MRKWAIMLSLLMISITGCGKDNATEIEATRYSQEDTQERLNDTETEEEAYSYDSYDIDKMYAYDNGNIYFRKYFSENKEEGGVQGSFEDVTNTSLKKIMCMDSDGNISEVIDDYGVGSLFVYDDVIYSQMYDGYQTVVYSINLSSGEQTLYDSSEIKGFINGKIVCIGNGKGIYIIDTETGEESCLNENAHGYITISKDRIFYAEYDDDYSLLINELNLDDEITQVAKVGKEDIEDCITVPVVTCFQVLSDDLYIAVGSYSGSESVYQGGKLVKAKIDGSGFEFVKDISEKFCISDNRELTVTEDVEAGIPYMSKDYDICIIKDSDGDIENLMEKSEYEKLGFGGVSDYTEDKYWGISELELIDDKLFFTITTGTRDESNDAGWRNYYKRDETFNCYKNMATDEIIIWNNY